MYPLSYIEPVFRPPSEWKSLILQVTNGCSWNRCAFCEMYKDEQKRFRPKAVEQIEDELKLLAQASYQVRRVFLADGDAMALSTRRLVEILQLIKRYYPDVQRISSYCLPRNVANKTQAELEQLRQLGLSLVYVGCESGDDQTLAWVDKGETYQSSLAALNKLKQAGIESSVMILNGLAGPEHSEQHALNSAALMNAAQPEYLSSLVVSFSTVQEQQRFAAAVPNWRPLSQLELFQEMQTLLQALQLEKTIFRSDHASNYLVLKGVLGKDKARLLNQLDMAIHHPQRANLRQEHQRGL